MRGNDKIIVLHNTSYTTSFNNKISYISRLSPQLLKNQHVWQEDAMVQITYEVIKSLCVPQQCKVCSQSGKTCGPSGPPDGPGVEGSDFVLYVSGVTTERCGKENIVAYAAYCQLEAELDRWEGPNTWFWCCHMRFSHFSESKLKFCKVFIVS